MPGKFNISWKDDVYDGFALDMKSLLELCVDINHNNQVADIKNELQKLHDAMPGGEAKTELNNVIQKITEISGFIDSFIKNQNKKTSALNKLNANKYDGLGAKGLYMSDVLELKYLMNSNKSKFFESKYDDIAKKNVSGKDALPLDLRAALDSFNLQDDYNSYDKNEDLFKRVDDLFNRFGQMQNLMGRIYMFQENYRTVGRLKDHIANKETQLKKLGEIAYNHPDLVFSAVEEERSRAQRMMSESGRLRKVSEDNYNEKSKELEKAKKEKSDIEKRKEEFDQKKAQAESELKTVEKELAEAEKDERLMLEIKDMKFSGLKAFEKAKMQDVPTANEIVNGNYGDHIREQRSRQHKYSDEAQKNNAKIQEMVANNKDLKAFMEKATLVSQYRVYPTMMIKLGEELVRLPSSLGINARSMSILKLQAALKNAFDKDERVKPLYEAVSVAVDFCPRDFKLGELNSQYMESLTKSGNEFQVNLAKDKSYQVALNIAILMEEGQSVTDMLSEMKYNDSKNKGTEVDQKKKKSDESKRKELEARQKKIKNDISKLKKSKDYIKDSEKLLDLMKKSEENNINANECRLNIAGTFAVADLNEEQLQKRKDDDVKREKYTVIAEMEIVLQKLPAKPEAIVQEMKKAVEDIKKTDDIGDVRKAFKSFSDNLTKMDNEVKGRAYDLTKKSESLQNEILNWDYDRRIKICDEKIAKCEKETNDAKTDLDKHQKEYDEYSRKFQDILSVNHKLDNMYEDKKSIKRFEKDKENGEQAKSELKGKLFFTQLQRTFTSFNQRKDHNKKDHQNTPEYTAMDTKLNELLALDPGSVTAAVYRKALTDLKAVALTYIQKKNEQSFHWFPSKLRKYRLQYAKGLVDMCTNQLDTVDETDFKTIDPSVDKYLSDVSNQKLEIKEFTKEEFLSQLTDQKQEGLKVYKHEMGIDEVAGVPFKIPGNEQVNQQPLNVSKVEEQPIENVQFAQGAQNKEVLKQ